MNEHDYEHVEYVKCTNCKKIVDCHDYYNKDNDYDSEECKGEKNVKLG